MLILFYFINQIKIVTPTIFNKKRKRENSLWKKLKLAYASFLNYYLKLQSKQNNENKGATISF